MPATLRADRIRLAAAVALGTTIALAFLVRLVAIAEPLGIDQSLWASAVRGMARGQLLYRDVWEQRPPGIYWLYLAAFEVFGWSTATVAWLDVIVAALTTCLLLAIVGQLTTTMTGVGAAALFVALTMPAWLHGHGGFLERSVSETFIVPCIGAAAWFGARFRERPALPRAFGVGLFCGAAVVLKPNAGLYLPALLVWTAVYRTNSRPTRPSLVRVAGVAAGAAAIVPGVAILWLWQLGLLREARIAVIEFNRYYVGEGFAPAAYALALSKAVWLRIKTEPLWLAGAVGAFAAVWDLARRRWLPPIAGLAVAWGAAATVVVVLNGSRLYNSYFINFHAPLAILGTWWLAQAAGSRPRRILVLVTAVLMVALLVRGGYVNRVYRWAASDLAVLTGRADTTAYLEKFGGYGNKRGYSARANAELAEYVRSHTDPDDRVFLFGINGAGVYFASDRLTAHRFLRVNFFVATDFPDPRFRLEAVVSDLQSAAPRYLVFERLHTKSEMAREADGLPNDPRLASLLRRYQLETVIEDFTLYRRVD